MRRRLRQKLEFLIEDSAEASPPTDEELKAWLAQHADEYRSEPRVAFRQVFVSRDRRGAAAEADAAAILKRLTAEGSSARIATLGDATMLPADFDLAPLRDVDRMFGAGFARQLDAAELGKWSGPIRSGYGLHLVLVRERVEGALAEPRRRCVRWRGARSWPSAASANWPRCTTACSRSTRWSSSGRRRRRARRVVRRRRRPGRDRAPGPACV